MENTPTQNLNLPARIKAFREYLGLTYAGFVDILTLDHDEPQIHNEESVKALESGDRAPSQLDYQRLVGYYERLNENWLRYGEGEMLLKPPVES